MNPSDIRSPVARAAFVLLGVFWAGAAWFVLLEGGFTKTYRFSRETTFVGGAGGLLMALVFLLLATIAVSIVLRSLGARAVAYGVLVALVFVPPCVYWLRT